MVRPLILYHAHCADGFCAAWVAHRKFGDEADYLPVQYGEPPPSVVGRDVFILDFSYRRPVMLDIVRDARAVVVLDHHKTAAEELAGDLSISLYRDGHEPSLRQPHIVFDMDKSGGRLTWEHFNPGQPSPWLVDYTEDRDLWRWALPSSKEIGAALATYPRTFEAWDRLAFYAGPAGQTGLWSGLVKEGAAILRYQDQLVESICATARGVDIGGYRVLAANTCVLISEVAGRLAKGSPFGAVWFIRSDGKKQWSLRSHDDGVDVSEVARKRGGGGHRNAAGFEELS